MEEQRAPKELPARERLQQLSQEEMNNLIQDYYELTNSEIEEKYQIKSASGIQKYFPQNLIEDEFCDKCGSQLIKEYPLKSKKDDYVPHSCPECNHIPETKENTKVKCFCKACIKERSEKAEAEREKRMLQEKEKLAQKRAELKAKVKENLKAEILFDDLSFSEKIHYMAFLRAKEEVNSAYAVYNSAETFFSIAPTEEQNNKILFNLIEKGAINLFLGISDLGYESFLERELYYVAKEDALVPNIADSDNMLQRIHEIIDNDYLLVRNDLMELWQTITLYESLKFLDFSMRNIDLEARTGRTTVSYIRDGLNHYTVFQICKVIDRVTETAAKDFLSGERIGRKRISNNLISHMNNYMIKGVNEKWNETYKEIDFRNISGPQSILSDIFFNDILGIGDRGFRVIPSFDYLDELMGYDFKEKTPLEILNNNTNDDFNCNANSNTDEEISDDNEKKNEDNIRPFFPEDDCPF